MYSREQKSRKIVIFNTRSSPYTTTDDAAYISQFARVTFAYIYMQKVVIFDLWHVSNLGIFIKYFLVSSLHKVYVSVHGKCLFDEISDQIEIL